MRGWLRAAEDREDTVSAQPTAAAAGTIGIGGDLTVNRMGFGAMRVTGRGIWGEPPSRDRAIATLRRVVELGVNFIDTADSYGPSVSEELIAEALYPYPDELVIATKGGLARPGPNRWIPDGRPEHLREACEGSLRRLRLEQIPLWQFHRPDPKVPLAESMGVIAELKDEGKIRHVGISNVSEAQFREAERILPIVSIQNRFNVTDRESEPLVDLCEQEDMVFLPWAPIQQADRRAAVAVAAERRGATERQIVLAWLLAISPAILPIPGTGSPEHAEENVAATSIELSRNEIEAISKGGLSRRTEAQTRRRGRCPWVMADGNQERGSVPLRTRSAEPSAGGCDETASASAEPGGVEFVCRPSRQVRCPQACAAARRHQADLQMHSSWRASHGYRPDASGTRGPSTLAALAGRRGVYGGGRHPAQQHLGRGSHPWNLVPLVRPADPSQS
jgi:pyridoxine 4-dehydrogenase